jgi:hypothetical protein
MNCGRGHAVTLLDLPQLGAIVNGFSRNLFRLETLPVYLSASDGGDVARYLAGQPEPDPARKGPWLERLRAEYAEGRQRQRVHVLHSPLGGYLRYELEWGYLPNSAAGEDIRILDTAERPLPRGLADIDHDFWLVDGQTAVRMIYDSDGRFIGADVADPAEVPRYAAAHEAALSAAEAFGSYWARHPEFHQANQRRLEKRLGQQ